jgi:hypothetical protein
MKIKKLTSGAVYVLYAVIMLEGILMATPFALYLYSFYFPFLEGVQQNILTAWISSFFFRHVVVETNSTFLEIIGWIRLLFPIGLIGFFVFAFQVYWIGISGTLNICFSCWQGLGCFLHGPE